MGDPSAAPVPRRRTGRPRSRRARPVTRARRQLIVHVGTPKTGSTSIQRMLMRLAPRLRRAGVQVVRTTRERGNSPTLSAPEPRAAKAWRDLADEIAASARDRFVVSAEIFSKPGRREAMAGRLAAFAAAARLDVHVVGYVRPQWQWLESAYAQRVGGMRLGVPFAAFAAAQLAAAADATMLDYNAVFAPYRRAFGTRVVVTPLERAALPHGLLAHFLDVLGVPDLAARTAAAAPANPRRGAKDLEVRRLVWCAIARRDGAPVRAARLRGPLRGLEARLADDAPFAGFDAADIARVDARFAAANARFARDYGIDAGGVLFAQRRSATGRPNIAHWPHFGARERRRVARFVHRRVGIDLDAAATRAAPPDTPDRTAPCAPAAGSLDLADR